MFLSIGAIGAVASKLFALRFRSFAKAFDQSRSRGDLRGLAQLVAHTSTKYRLRAISVFSNLRFASAPSSPAPSPRIEASVFRQADRTSRESLEAPMGCCDETTARVPDTDVSRRSLFKGAALIASVVPAARPRRSEAQGKKVSLAFCSQLLCVVPYEIA